ncbi:MAG: acetoacetate decarboxylase family protein [Promethearchaeota archaeon]
MSLVQSKDTLQKRKKKFAKGFLLGNVNMVMVMFKTDPAILKRIIPPPLTPTPDSLGMAYVAEFLRPNFIQPYNEAALFVQAQYNNERGNYCLAMPVDNDLAMAAGREVYGFPKKIADKITLTRKGNSIHGLCIRHEIPIIEIKATMQTPFPEKFTSTPNFLIKAFPGLDGVSVDDNPRLIRLLNQIEYGPIEIGPGELQLNKSPDDPLYEIPVLEVTTAAYTTQTNIWLKTGETLKELNPDDYYPYFFNKYDWDL